MKRKRFLLVEKTEKKKILFICTHNSARSQMAEALAQKLIGKKYEVHSAGVEPRYVHPYAIKAMKEIGVDISGARSKGLDEFTETEIDIAVTLCSDAEKNCPYLPNARKRIHAPFRDPATIEDFREIREELKKWIMKEFK